jgi:tRNA(Ser,Leu) C12 N-acetylase TAN1
MEFNTLIESILTEAKKARKTKSLGTKKFKEIAKKAGKKYHSKKVGMKVAGAIEQKLKQKKK